MISLIILGIIFLYAIISYNTLTRKRNNVDNAFGSIDVMLKKRFDLIPNLVATVQQYAKHEEETFTKIERNEKRADSGGYYPCGRSCRQPDYRRGMAGYPYRLYSRLDRTIFLYSVQVGRIMCLL